MNRQDFIANIRSALGRAKPTSPDSTPVRYSNLSDAVSDAEDVRIEIEVRSKALLDQAAEALQTAGWNVHRAATLEDVGDTVATICKNIEASSVLRSGHEILDDAHVDDALKASGIEVQNMSLGAELSESEREEARLQHRREVFKTDAGITGGDYIIAETGTLVIHPQKGVSRLTSLAPPVHIAVMQRGQVLPSLDELFLLEHVDLLSGNRHGSMNLISGPSRTGDIEAKIVHGIHGPIQTHIMLVG